MEAQVVRYRAMTREEQGRLALRLHRLGIRRQHPKASPAEVEILLCQRLALARAL